MQNITPGNGSFTDTAGTLYTIDQDCNARQDGVVMAGGEQTVLMSYSDGIVYAWDRMTKSWWRWERQHWTMGSPVQA